MDEKSALLYAKLNQHKYLVRKTYNFIGWALRKVSNPYVACSFGKDSAVMLHLVLQHRPDVDVRFIRWKNETEHIDNYDEVISQWGNINLDQIELFRENLNDSRKERFDSQGYDSYFIGLRQSESVARRITLKSHGKFYLNKSGMIRISPLAEWSNEDVAAYLFSNNLPILNSYRKHGIKSRTASRIPRVNYGIRESFLTDLKHRDFNAFQQLLIKFPEIREYV
jgi:3'-phosphoadenosine 5'-phosphosulfate sulfotransferase (PAPS reductase)/FAD synthetase